MLFDCNMFALLFLISKEVLVYLFFLVQFPSFQSWKHQPFFYALSVLSWTLTQPIFQTLLKGIFFTHFVQQEMSQEHSKQLQGRIWFIY